MLHNQQNAIFSTSSKSSSSSRITEYVSSPLASPLHIADNNQRPARTTPTTSSTSLFSTKESRGVTSTLISQLAIVALKLRLTKQAKVLCDVTASSRKILLQNTVGPVTVKGRNWSSPLGLTCRAIEATVETCKLDMNSIVNRRKLVLVTPAEGKAMIALDDTDFGNFLKHPLLLAQTPTLKSTATPDMTSSDGSDPKKFVFSREGAKIQKEKNTVTFYGTCVGQTWKCELTRGVNNGSKRAIIDVSLVNSENQVPELDVDAIAMELSMLLGHFFNDIVFELDGTFLTFQDFKIHQKPSEENATMLMALGITVRKFPSPGLEF